jgi:hypothetical protein
MSIIFRDSNGKQIKGITAGYFEDACDVCGRKAHAGWAGHRNISVCYHCATEALPSLIADAMRAMGRNLHILHDTRERMLNRFHYSAASANAMDFPDLATED